MIAILATVGALPFVVFSMAFLSVIGDRLAEYSETVSTAALQAVIATARERAIEGPRRDLPALLLQAADEADGSRLTELLRDTLAPRPEYLALIVLDAAGRVVASYPDTGLSPGYVYRAKAARTASGVTAFSPPFQSDTFGRPVIEAAYAGERRSVVAIIDLEWLSAKLYLAMASPQDRVGIVWLDGRYLASSDPSRMRSGERVDARLLGGKPTAYADERGEYTVLSAPIHGSDWRGVYYRSNLPIRESTATFGLRITMLGLVSFALAGLIAYLVWHRLLTPLSTLTRKIAAIAEGRYGERLELDVPDELMEMARAINSMAESIERRGEELERSERRYRMTFERSGAPVLLLSADDASVRDANPAALEYYGYAPEEIRRLGIADLDASGRKVQAYKGADRLSSRHRLSSGEIRDVILYVSPLELGDEELLHALVFDVTDQRIAEERSVAALEEKTLLLREVYHRVKNNLQVISSLLSMQAAVTADRSVSTALQGAQDRVFAMSLAHEIVYQMPDISSVDAGDYASRLVAYLADEYKVPRDSVLAAYEPMPLSLERAVPFGLLLGEIVSNALKYGIPPGTDGRVRVSLSLDEAGRDRMVCLVVEDDGPGLPPEVADKGSLGISLIAGLADQLRGTVAWERPSGGGTRVTVRFDSSADGKAR
ncbi:MAG TPA: histidine kinase dimerization/phosphoacceptor domain -containing protein [Spirochaetales bacterium]|nr:histidine kinase dimerization/phosphoacceptor domain -containing protein [Spirochaetales bacterium]